MLNIKFFKNLNLYFEKGNIEHLNWLKYFDILISFDEKNWKKIKKIENIILSSKIEFKLFKKFRFLKFELNQKNLKIKNNFEIKICELEII